MASGFIILRDRSCFATRWTGYDETLRIVIRTIPTLTSNAEFTHLLSQFVPAEDAPEDLEMGWGFIHPHTGTIVRRELDLRGLSNVHHDLFWVALQKAVNRLKWPEREFSWLNPEVPIRLLQMRKCSLRGTDPLEHSDWTILAGEHFDRISSKE